MDKFVQINVIWGLRQINFRSSTIMEMRYYYKLVPVDSVCTDSSNALQHGTGTNSDVTNDDEIIKSDCFVKSSVRKLIK